MEQLNDEKSKNELLEQQNNILLAEKKQLQKQVQDLLSVINRNGDSSAPSSEPGLLPDISIPESPQPDHQQDEIFRLAREDSNTSPFMFASSMLMIVSCCILCFFGFMVGNTGGSEMMTTAESSFMGRMLFSTPDVPLPNNRWTVSLDLSYVWVVPIIAGIMFIFAYGLSSIARDMKKKPRKVVRSSEMGVTC